MVTITIEGLAELQAAAARCAAALDQDVEEAILEAANAVAGRVRQTAPRQTGRLIGSVGVSDEGSSIVVEVTAISPDRWRFPYPVKVERQQGFFAAAVAAETDELNRIADEVGDDMARRWGG